MRLEAPLLLRIMSSCTWDCLDASPGCPRHRAYAYGLTGSHTVPKALCDHVSRVIARLGSLACSNGKLSPVCLRAEVCLALVALVCTPGTVIGCPRFLTSVSGATGQIRGEWHLTLTVIICGRRVFLPRMTHHASHGGTACYMCAMSANIYWEQTYGKNGRMTPYYRLRF
jgi:hypothetical protein